MKPYSKDLRIRVLAAVDGGIPRTEVAQTFSVSMPTIKRWLKRRRETGDVIAKPIPGRSPLEGATLKEWLPEHLKENPDLLTPEEHCGAFEERTGMKVSTATMRPGAFADAWPGASMPGAWCSWTNAERTPP